MIIQSSGAGASELRKIQLTRTLILWQRSRGHRSSTDDILCAHAGHSARPDAARILDLGAGQGSVTLMLANTHPVAEVTAIEAQEISYRLLMRNVVENGLATRVTPIHADLRTVDLGDARFDLITGSPPYVRPGAGVLPRDAQRAAARFELRGGIEEYCLAATRWLASDGIAVFLMNAADDERSRRAVVKTGLFLKQRLIVHPRPEAAARFVLYHLQRVAPPAILETRLTVRDGAGHWTREMAAIRRELDLPESCR